MATARYRLRISRALAPCVLPVYTSTVELLGMPYRFRSLALWLRGLNKPRLADGHSSMIGGPAGTNSASLSMIIVTPVALLRNSFARCGCEKEGGINLSKSAEESASISESGLPTLRDSM